MNGREKQQQLQASGMNNPKKKSGSAINAHISEAHQQHRHKEFAAHLCVCKPELGVMHLFNAVRKRLRLAQANTQQRQAKGRPKKRRPDKKPAL